MQVSTSQENSWLLRNPTVRFHAHENEQVRSTMSQLNPVHKHSFRKVHFHISLQTEVRVFCIGLHWVAEVSKDWHHYTGRVTLVYGRSVFTRLWVRSQLFHFCTESAFATNRISKVIRCSLKERGSTPTKVRAFLFVTTTGAALRPIRLPPLWIPEAHFAGVRRKKREADHSPSGSDALLQYDV